MGRASSRRSGQARHASERVDGPTNRLGLYLRRSAPALGKGVPSSCPDATREPAPGRNRRSDRAGRTRGASRRSGRLVLHRAGCHAAQHHLDPVAGEMSGAQSAGKRLAVPARQLALKPNSNPTTTSSTIAARLGTTSSINFLADHVHRPLQLGPWVLINESWYIRRAALYKRQLP